MPDHEPESQEEILTAYEASLTADDIPSEDEFLPWSDPDTSPPAELLALSDQELYDLLENTPAQPAPAQPAPAQPAPAQPAPAQSAPAWPSAHPAETPADPPFERLPAPGAQPPASPASGAHPPASPASALPPLPHGSQPGEGQGWSERDAWPLGSAAGAATVPGAEGLERGFGEGGVLDELAAGMALTGFADDACRRIADLDDDCLIGVLRAWRRVTSWAQARELAMVAELARRRPADGTPPASGPGEFPHQISEFAADEVGLALTLTRMSAHNQFALAMDLIDRPAIATALESGQIDLPKARILISMICPLEPAHADAVEAAVLPRAPALTTGELRAALQRAILAVDPAAARRRREEAQKDARVERWTDPEGTATLAGRYLPPAEVLAADKRLCAIAKAWKKQGAQGGLDLLRAHVYLALLLGQNIATPPPGLLLPPDSPLPGQATAPPTARPTAPPSGRTSGSPAGEPPTTAAGEPTTAAGVPLPPLTGEVNVTIPMLTLLGLADAPGEAAGYGPLHADTARRLADAMSTNRTTRWGVIITNQDCHAMGYGYGARARPLSAGGWKITLTTEPIAPYP